MVRATFFIRKHVEMSSGPYTGAKIIVWAISWRENREGADETCSSRNEPIRVDRLEPEKRWESRIMVLQTMRQILWHFEVHDDGDDDDDVRDNDDDDDDGDDDHDESYFFSFASMV